MDDLSSQEKSFVRFENIDKSYDGKLLVVENLNLDIAKGEFLTLLGPSGSGTVSYTHLTLPTILLV